MWGGYAMAMLLASGSAVAQVRVLDWNIERGKHIEGVAKTIRGQDPDICVLQEVDLHAKRTGYSDIADRLAKTLQMHYVFGRAFEELSQGDGERAAYLGQAILTRLPIRSSRVLHFERQTKFWKPEPFIPNWRIMQRRKGGRVALVAELGRTDVEFVLYNLHLESRGLGATRFGQLKEVLADAQRYNRNVPVIIAGDLNTKYRPGLFARRLREAGFESCFGRRKVRTHVIYGALDWIFVRGPAKCGDARVVRGSKASDHDPVVAEITIPSGVRAGSSSSSPNIF